ncbi:isoaspartyl peptidase/L-asparaginase [Croceicoccus sp. F390]|uniref:Isoaspartyl peptidase/L-asparaginase n=1 Tax=Croceicoccus esteveae TaxID=3075597 RepID=A0ABU2ZHF8_9SPHN|nr:isoaspartyl peptidase/L-asparaginase [Croceicoccus sp. F390]MDT0575820.1 isoaspartyl peptidase/L-asparaginase [Croceicoccus sp. F390]
MKQGDDMTDNSWTIAIHGGAGSMRPDAFPKERQDACKKALDRALDAGRATLAAGGTALDAVERAVMVLEDDPLFNAACGGVLTFEGRIEMDAAIMDGATRQAGAVAGLLTTRNPVCAARAVMQHTPHVLLANEGANRFAMERGLRQEEPAYFTTAERHEQWQEFVERGEGWFDAELKYGTVGAVARDCDGHVAAATSTGGLTGKRWSRVGDSPLIGAGTYADDRSCAISATGTGEVFIRLAAAHEIGARMRLLGETVQEAATHVIGEVGRMEGHGGVIFASADGSSGFVFNTPGMFRARADSTGSHEVAIFA